MDRGAAAAACEPSGGGTEGAGAQDAQDAGKPDALLAPVVREGRRRHPDRGASVGAGAPPLHWAVP